MKKRTMTLVISLLLVALVAVGGTLAWLKAQTEDVVNTFTYGDINVTLNETDADNDGNAKANEYKMIPGATIDKDPVATILKGSEDCYLFVKAVKSENFGTFLTYDMAAGWTELKPGSDIWWRVVPSNTNADQPFDIIAGNEVTVLDSVTKEMLTAETFSEPTVTFTAYAVQQANDDGEFTPEQAWKIAQGQDPLN